MSDTVEETAQDAESQAREALDKLTPKQRALVLSYTDPESETYSNKTRSAIAAGYSERSAHAYGQNALKTHSVRNAVQALFELYGLGAEVRASAIAEVAKGEYRQKSDVEYFDAAGNASGKMRTTRTPTAQQRLQAVKLANEMDGTDAQRSAAQEAMSQVLRGKIRQVQRSEERQAQGRTVEAQEPDE